MAATLPSITESEAVWVIAGVRATSWIYASGWNPPPTVSFVETDNKPTHRAVVAGEDPEPAASTMELGPASAAQS